MALLHIYDSSDWTIRETSWARSATNTLAVADNSALITGLDGIVAAGTKYDRLLFETHGTPGEIYFGDDTVDTTFWRGVLSHRFWSILNMNSRIYFNGCNVAEGREGWQFLEAAASVFLSSVGGQIFGQTSLGIANPFNGHVVHLWGSTRTLFVDKSGAIVERFEQ